MARAERGPARGAASIHKLQAAVGFLRHPPPCALPAKFQPVRPARNHLVINVSGEVNAELGGNDSGAVPSDRFGVLPICNSSVPPFTMSAWRNQI